MVDTWPLLNGKGFELTFLETGVQYSTNAALVVIPLVEMEWYRIWTSNPWNWSPTLCQCSQQHSFSISTTSNEIIFFVGPHNEAVNDNNNNDNDNNGSNNNDDSNDNDNNDNNGNNNIDDDDVNDDDKDDNNDNNSETKNSKTSTRVFFSEKQIA